MDARGAVTEVIRLSCHRVADGSRSENNKSEREREQQMINDIREAC